jgi:glycosyltransferase involved in cell wall biosynthesis
MHVLQTVKKRGWSGETAFILMLSNVLARRGVRVTVAAAPGSESAKRAAAAGLPLLPIRFDKQAWGLPFIADGARLRDFVRRESVDVVHCHASFDHWVCAWMRRRTPFTLVRTKHNRKEIAGHLLNRWLYRAATDAVVTISDAVRADVAATRFLAESPPMLGYGFEPTRFGRVDRAAARARLATLGLDPATVRVLLYVGRITERKRVGLLLEAAARLRCRIPSLVTLVVGGGDPPIVARLHELHSDPAVRFLGHRDDVPELLAAADVFCYPTRDEAFGLAPLEAMAAGCPVVLTDEPGFRQYAVPGVNALVAAAAEPDALARAIERPLVDAALAASLRAAGLATAPQFEIDGVGERYLGLYEGLLSARGRPALCRRARRAQNLPPSAAAADPVAGDAWARSSIG